MSPASAIKPGILPVLEKGSKVYTGSSLAYNYTVYIEPPQGFNASFEAVGCFLAYQDKVLLLKRNADKIEGNVWCIPGGKVEKKESPREAVIRETFEETGVDVNTKGLKEIGTHYIRLPHTDFVFYMFQLSFSEQPNVKLASDEHQEARWLTGYQALELPLLMGEIESFIHYNNIMV